MESESKRQKPLTFKDFIKKRFLRVYIPFFVTNLFYLIFISIKKPDTTAIDYVKYTLGFKLADPISWFVLVILLFYFVVFLLSHFHNRAIKALGMIALTLCFLIIGFSIGLPFYSLVAIPAFPLGYISSLYKREIISFFDVKWRKWSVICISFTLFIATVCIIAKFVPVNLHLIHLAIAASGIIVFFWLIPLFINQDADSKPLNWLGDISYELYLVHYKSFYILRFIFGFVPIVLFPVILAVSWMFHKLDNYLIKLVSR